MSTHLDHTTSLYIDLNAAQFGSDKSTVATLWRLQSAVSNKKNVTWGFDVGRFSLIFTDVAVCTVSDQSHRPIKSTKVSAEVINEWEGDVRQTVRVSFKYLLYNVSSLWKKQFNAPMFFVSLRFIKRGSLGSGVSILSRTVELVQQPAKPLMGGRGGGTKLQEQKQNKQIILGMITEGFLVFMCAPGFFWRTVLV